MKFEQHYKTAQEKGTHYIPSADFILDNSSVKFNSNGSVKKLKTKIDIYYIFYGQMYKVCAGFEFDGVSTGIFSIIFGQYDKSTLSAGLLHDWFYSEYYNLERQLADVYLRIVIKYSGRSIRAWIFYVAVRLFGWLFYKRKTETLC